ncbi:MAG TPA: hypothetical protein VJJ52_02825 [Candidatus Nanoarchaeia archaeon]|nr:hypothetical protein [Candidatus Nanoarchaeia archaeon]
MENYTVVSARTWKNLDRVARLNRIATKNLNDDLLEKYYEN